jgi:uncharacterized protein YoaH (UPF0181 family)
MPTLTTPYHPPAQTNAHRLDRILRIAFAQQAAEVGRRLSPSILDGDGDVPGMDHWVDHLAAVLKPTMTQLFQQGIVESRRRIAALSGGISGGVYRPPQRIVPHFRHTFGTARKQLGVSFDLFDPRVLRAVDKATLLFCEETNDTATVDLKEAIRKLRALLKRGLERGKAIAQLAREIKRIFSDQARAFRIATTETSRAVHSGALFNAMESSLRLKKEWLASSDACDRCQALMELGPIELDEPFMVDGTGPYARIMHPPLHPHDFCTMTEVLA